MSVSKRLRFEVFRRDGFACRYCGASASDTTLTIDHVVPIALGGTDEPANLVTACAPCNAGKTSSHPDAPLVADVAQDAMRWAQAQKVAAAQMLEEYEARDALHREFEKRWGEWASEGKAVLLPGGWRQSVDSFMSAGLPMPILLECIDTAMRRRNIKDQDLFRYTCGIAWRRIAELRDATAAVVAPSGEPKVARPSAHEDALKFLMGYLLELERLGEPEHRASLSLEFLDAHAEDENPDGTPRDYLWWGEDLIAAVQLFKDQLAEAWLARGWNEVGWRLVSILPGGEARLDELMADHRREDFEVTYAELLPRVVREAVEQLMRRDGESVSPAAASGGQCT